MSANPHGYNLRAIRNLLKTAFDANELDALCLDYYFHVFQKFSPGMETEAKITILLSDCLKLPTGLDRLLEIVRNEAGDVFNLFDSHLTSQRTPAQNKTTTTESALLLPELAEWKVIHNDVQKLLSELEIPISFLTLYRFEPSPHPLIEAGLVWHKRCIPLLESMFDKWDLQYAHTPELEKLPNYIDNLEPIKKQLMIEIDQEEFTELYSWFMSLKNTLWDILIVADRKIMVIIEKMQSTNEV